MRAQRAIHGFTCVVCMALLISPSSAAGQASAKALFYDPAHGRAQVAASQPLDPVTGLTAIGPNDNYPASDVVGIHYWFENEHGTRYADVYAARAAGARVRLHIRSNVDGYLTAWLTDGNDGGVQLTPMDGPYPGYLLKADTVYVIPADLTVPPKNPSSRVLVHYARSQTQMVDNVGDGRGEIRRISAAKARDGALALVRETDATTRGQVGTYVVHREGHQPGAEIEIGR